MNYSLGHKNEEKKDRIRSAIFTFLLSVLVFLAIYFYKFTKIIPKTETVTTMLINFGDNRNGAEAEEPANQEGSLAAQATENIVEEQKPEKVEVVKKEPTPEKKPAEPVKERVITGNNPKNTAVKTETAKKQAVSKPKTTPTKSTANTAKTTTANSTTGTGDGKGTAAVGNLIRGRGTKTGSQGTDGTTGNQGDPLGGDGNGTSKIGVDRQLIGFIPGTMGRGGSQPEHNCTASGSITISYTVDKAGNVISARRSGGISDACVASTSVAWVKRYVKAERASTASTGTYRITF